MNNLTATTALIPIIENPEGEQTVNARDLHSFLKVGKDFSTWIKNRIESCNFKENRDFVVIPGIGVNPLGGRPSIDYHLGMRMAQHLAMIERTKKGEEARDYFIECERIAKGKTLSPGEYLVQQARMLLRIEQEQKRQSEHQAITDKKVEQLEVNAKTETEYFTISGWAALINLKMPIEEAARLGKIAAQMSRKLGVSMGTARHIHFGRVNTYHESILSAVMGVGDEY